MMSFIYWLTRGFERSHDGQKPNVLYINRYHFEHLRQEFADPDDLDSIMRVLGMTIMITEEAVNPHLARTDNPEQLRPPHFGRHHRKAGGAD